MSQPKKMLIAFDFDHTIIDGNSDIEITHLCPGGVVPAPIKEKYSDKGWTPYMGAIFQCLHDNKTTIKEMEQTIQDIPLTAGMTELFEFLDSDQFEVIIISDSNSVFIDYSLKKHNLQDIVKKVYTNPAQYDEKGLLTIDFYHTQDWCDLSTENLCKGHILEEHIKHADHAYQSVLYVGDGSNDLCPSLRLKESHFTFPRKQFSLWKKLKALGCLDGETSDVEMKAQIVEWSSALEILRVCKQLLEDSVAEMTSST